MAETGARARGRQDFFERQSLAVSGAQALGWLAETLGNADRYPPSHPFVISSAERLLLSCEDILSDRTEAVFTFGPGEAWLEAVPCFLDEPSRELAERLVGNEITSIIILRGVTRSEVLSFVLLLSGPEPGIGSGSWSSVLLHQQGIAHIRIGDAPRAPWSGDVSEDDIAECGKVHEQARTFVKETLRSLRTRPKVDGPAVTGAVEALVGGVIKSRDAMIAACWTGGDEYAAVHPVNVAVLSACFGSYLSMPERALAQLGCAGLLHDIGKSLLPPEIACSAGPLSDDHRRRLERHPADGALLLGVVPGIDAAAVTAACEHHRPSAPDDDTVLHPVSRIVAIADAVEGLTSLRVRFGIPLPPEDAVRLMLDGQGQRFDPAILKAFIAMIGVFPLGTELSLDTGERGRVVGRGNDALRPRVRLFEGVRPGRVVSLAERVNGRFRRSAAGEAPRSAGA